MGTKQMFFELLGFKQMFLELLGFTIHDPGGNTFCPFLCCLLFLIYLKEFISYSSLPIYNKFNHLKCTSIHTSIKIP